MASNTPRADKAQLRDQARQKALALRAAQAKSRKRNRIFAISGLVVAVALLAVVFIWILSQAKPAATALDSKHPLVGVTAPSTALSNGSIPVGAKGTAGSTSGAGAVTVAVYYDYMCPYCAKFEGANASALDALVAAGQVTMEYHPVAFLDQSSQGSQYSTRALQAVAYVAEADPAHFVAFHEALLAGQPAENTTGLSDVQITTIAVQAGVPQAVADKITTGGAKFTKWAAAVTQQAVLNKVTGTPTVLINGKQTASTLDLYTVGPLEAAIAKAKG